MRLYASGT